MTKMNANPYEDPDKKQYHLVRLVSSMVLMLIGIVFYFGFSEKVDTQLKYYFVMFLSASVIVLSSIGVYYHLKRYIELLRNT
jgi:uncharacterized membrane protein AbrB (regulator of aidB expression)